MYGAAAPADDSAEVAALRAELQQLRERNERVERAAAEATADAQRLAAALAKAEADLEGLSSAYTSLDTHAVELQARLDRALSSAGTAPAAPAAVDVDALVQAARDEAEQEASAAMEDLLVCLGQEEDKVAALEAALAAARATAAAAGVRL